MSTWQVFADARSHFRWEESDQQPWREGLSDAQALRTVHDTSRLPSMQDLLIQGNFYLCLLRIFEFLNAHLCKRIFHNKKAGRSKLLENEKSKVDNSPMFRTGTGKSVAVKQSSIAKARSVLGDVDEVFADAGRCFNSCCLVFPFFSGSPAG